MVTCMVVAYFKPYDVGHRLCVSQTKITGFSFEKILEGLGL